MKRTSLLIFIFFSSLVATYPQSSEVLDAYVTEGLNNNLTLKQKHLSYQQAIEELNIARGAFFPNLNLNARYTVADGGRTIDFPVGDLLNPVYSTLSELTRNLPPTQQFQDMQVENQEFQFYRPTEHETKLELIQPIFYPQIYHNHKIKKNLMVLGKMHEASYRRQLIAEIKIAYFNYLKTLELQEILTNSKQVVQENIRVNRSLYTNEKITIDNVYKAEAELQKLEQQLASAAKNRRSTKGYFNHLLNRPLDTEITVDSLFSVRAFPSQLDSAQKTAISNSKDLEALKTIITVAEKNIELEKSGYLPTVSAVIDYGFQGSTYAFTADDDFVLASLVMKWELFKGRQNRSKVQKAIINHQIQQTKYEEAKNQIELQVIHLFYEVDALQKQIEAIEKENMANQEIFNVIKKKYNQGRANMLEFTDARTAYLNSKQQRTIARFDYYILLTELEKLLGIFNEPTISK